MESEFSSASQRVNRDRQKQQERAKKKLEQEMEERRLAEEATNNFLAQKREHSFFEAKRKELEESELARSGGVRFRRVMKPVPDMQLESDRVKLPASCLSDLTEQDAISQGPMVFELGLMEGDQVVSTTMVGVSEFTAAEGTVALPVKASQSLAKGRRMNEESRVVVKYVLPERFSKIKVQIQPLGDGFHLEGDQVVNIDIKTVLERALASCAVLSEGDFVPLRHDGKTFTLVVRHLAPEKQVLLLDTEVEVDLMPAENVQLAAEKIQQQEEEVRRREENAKQLLRDLPAEPMSGDAVMIRVRLPSGVSGTRRFTRHVPFSLVLTWVAGISVWDVDLVELVQSLPGVPSRTFGAGQASSTLSELGFLGKNESFNVRLVSGSKESDLLAPPTRLPTPADSPWEESMRNAESSLDKHLSEAASSQSQVDDETSNVDMFHLLVAAGAEPSSAARACQRHLTSLRALKASGLITEGSGRRIVGFIEKYNGGIARVADALFVPAPTPSPAPMSDRPSSDWSNEIASLEEMGIDCSNRVLVESLLESSQGNLSQVIEQMLA